MIQFHPIREYTRHRAERQNNNNNKGMKKKTHAKKHIQYLFSDACRLNKLCHWVRDGKCIFSVLFLFCFFRWINRVRLRQSTKTPNDSNQQRHRTRQNEWDERGNDRIKYWISNACHQLINFPQNTFAHNM